jgi:hypothetical protein
VSRNLTSYLLILLIGCRFAEDVGGGAAEVITCPINLINCGHVYLCEEPADNALDHVEICVDDDDDLAAVEAVYGVCLPTPRHEGLCIAGCDSHRGCNAFNGCWCTQ